MVKRTLTTKPSTVELERGTGFAHPRSKRRAVTQDSTDTAAMTLLAFRLESSSSMPTSACPLKKPVLALKKLQVKTLHSHASSITDDEDESSHSKISMRTFTTKRFIQSLVQPTLFKPVPSTTQPRRSQSVAAPSNLPTGKPLSAAPKLPAFLVSPKIMPLSYKL
jgi:hypothetical protein